MQSTQAQAPRPERAASADARSLKELFDLEEQRARSGLEASLAGIAHDIVAVSHVREIVRAHPYVAVGAAATLGFVAGPALGDAVRAALPSASRALGATAKSSLVATLLGASLGGGLGRLFDTHRSPS